MFDVSRRICTGGGGVEGARGLVLRWVDEIGLSRVLRGVLVTWWRPGR